MVEQIELKRCPFCGSKPVLYRSTFSERYRVQCEKGCGAQTTSYSSREYAKEAWDRRVEEKLDQSKRERLETAKQAMTGLLHYHDRMTNPMKAINENPSVNLGIDVYREALVYSLELIEEKLKG